MAKRGAKPKHYVTDDGETILGLRRDKKSGRFFPIGKGSPSFGSDEQQAVHRFKMWGAKQSGEQPNAISINVTEPAYDDFGQELPVVASMDDDGTQSVTQYVNKAAAAAYYRKLIYDNPKQAAIELDCEPLALLANVADLKPLAPSKALADFVTTYIEDKAPCRDECTASNTFWTEFLKITKSKLVTDLSREAFQNYRKKIKADKGERSDVWIRARFGKVKTIINHAIIEIELTAKEKDILSYVTLLKSPPAPTPNPLDISKSEMKAILKNADEWDTALILLALNSAYDPGDCNKLQWDMINWQNKTIRFDRQKSKKLAKKKLPRICKLWDRTIEALKAIKNNHTHVFISVQSIPAHVDTMNDHFKTLRDKAKIKKQITFKHLRKSSLTAASNDTTVPDRQINLLAGHSAGIKDHYVVRRNVELACDAIESYYFE